MGSFNVQCLTPANSRRSMLAVSGLLALTGVRPQIPDSVRTTKVGLSGPGWEDRCIWVHVAPPGEWRGHSEGVFELTKEHFESVKSVLDRKLTPCSFDYEHASIRPKGPATPASGYVQATEVRDDGLWALSEFTDEAWGYIKTGKYRFCSGVFDFVAVDPATGEPLLCVLDTIALTNRPFIDGQHPIALSRVAPAGVRAESVTLAVGAQKMKIQMKALVKLLDALGLSKEFTADQLMKALAFLDGGGEEGAEPAAAEAAAARAVAASAEAPAAAASADAPAAAASAETAATSTDAPAAAASADAAAVDAAPLPGDDAPAAEGDVDARLMAATGLDEAGLAAAITSNFDAVVAVLMGSAPAGDAAVAPLSRDIAIGAMRAQIIELQKKLNVYAVAETAALSKSLEGEVDALVKAGKLHPSARTATVALARKSPSEFRALAQVLQPTLPMGRHATAIEPPVGGSETLDSAQVVELTRQMKAMGVSKERIDAEIKKRLGAA